MDIIAEKILDLWFGPLESAEDSSQKKQQWFKKDPEFDKMLVNQFGDYLEPAYMGAFDRWTHAPDSQTALIVLLDQFPRNIYRGSDKSFRFDKKALALSLTAIDRDDFLKLPTPLGYFTLMPTMHAEDLAAQDLGIASFSRLAEHCPSDSRKMVDQAIDYARRHQEIIARFGRFPHRNKLLQRQSTAEEEQFLLEPGSSF